MSFLDRFARNVRGGWAGSGAGSSFLIDFNLLLHLKLFKALDSDLLLHFCAHVVVSNLSDLIYIT